MSEESQSNPEKKKMVGIWSSILYFAGVALVVTGLMFALPDNENETADGTTTTTVEHDDVTTTVVDAADTVDVEAPPVVLGDEPIADAAEVILPSVVHIQTTSGLGAGVIYSTDGLIMTAAHVVDGEDTVLIRFADGEQVEGTVVGARSGVDIAVIEVDRDNLPAATFNTEKPRVGQTAIAVGSPWGLESTVTAGIVSAVDQTSCDFGDCFSMLQTDAAINPGNSGGPLVDRLGQVLGINVSIRTESGANDGVGFAVPSAIAVGEAESIVSGDPVETAFLGVQGAFVDEGQAGALITEVIPDTAADDAGIEVDDVVIEFAGVEIQGITDLAAQVRTHTAGETVDVVLLRDGEEMTLSVTLGVRPPEESS